MKKLLLSVELSLMKHKSFSTQYWVSESEYSEKQISEILKLFIVYVWRKWFMKQAAEEQKEKNRPSSWNAFSLASLKTYL